MAHYVPQARFAELVGCHRVTVHQAITSGRLVDNGKGIDIQHLGSVAFAEAQTKRRASRGLPPSPWAQGLREAPPKRRGPPLGTKDDSKPKRPRGRPRKRPDEPKIPPAPRPAPPPAAPAHEPLPVVEKPRISDTDPDTDTDADTPPPKKQNWGRKPETVARDEARFAVQMETKDIERGIKAIKLQNDKIAYLARLKKLMPSSWHHRSIGRIAAVFADHMKTFADRHADQLEAMARDGAGRAQFFDFIDAEINKAMLAVQRTCDKEIERWLDEEQTEG